MLKQTTTLGIPLGLFALALLLIPWAEALSAPFVAIRHYLPYLLLVVASILSLSFNQTRLFLGLLLTALVMAVLLGDVQRAGMFAVPASPALLHLIAALHPVVLGLLLFSRERGLLTMIGMMRLAVILGLPFLVLLLAPKEAAPPVGWLGMRFLPEAISHLTPLPDLVLVIYGVVLLALLLRLFFWPAGVEAAFLGLVPGSGLALHSYPSSAGMQLFFSAAVLTVLWSIIRNSFHMAYRDELTGLPARRALREQLLKLGRRYSIAMLDVDHFKKFNDRYGHDVGDQVLQMVATYLARAGGGSKAYRYGGEEFTLVFSGRESAAVMPHLEKLRQAIADAQFVVRGKGRPRRKPQKGAKTGSSKAIAEKKKVQITISIGVSDSSGPEKTADEVIKAADKALYRAKKKGRNRVSV